MSSTFTWLDYSEHERRKMLEVIHAFHEQDTRDELGIGMIRDGLADLLFPGTSTVQTRVRYFLFIPWIYLEQERKGTPSREISKVARGREIELIAALEKGGERNAGIIGVEARGDLKRLPSNIYWQGMGVWGVRRFRGSQDQYHRWLDPWYRQLADRTKPDRGEPGEDGEITANWHPALPTAPVGWRESLNFHLTRAEAKFLRDGILNHNADSLLAHLVTLDKPLGNADFCWESEAFRSFPVANETQVNHARVFSEVMHGAALIYNLLLAEKAGKKDLAGSYRELIGEWSEHLDSRTQSVRSWDVAGFWSLLREQDVRITPRTFSFVSAWVQRVQQANNPAELTDNKAVRTAIREREAELKKGLARLENSRALELWNESSGTRRLDFRWTSARQIVNDILEGLGHA